ncbi:MAG TPA: lysylphosphatidylglycerol synthase domain-containing protein [Streptosporangiaceae bacterium]|nr:lysylphosphatidylglycerol synthase domain-containing protein [Streptosporangiaceae bacterium]
MSAVAFATFVAVGAIVTGNPAAAIVGVITSAVSAAAVTAFVIILRLPRGRARLQPLITAALRLSQRTVRQPSSDAAHLSATVLQRLGSVRLTTTAITLAFAWALVNWGADALCLAAAIAAARVAVPWSRLLIVWSAGSAAGSFSPTPFGLGLVDVALIAALHGAGVHVSDAVGAVLLYRVITFKIIITLIWSLRVARRRRTLLE